MDRSNRESLMPSLSRRAVLTLFAAAITAPALADDKFQVVTTFTVIADMARNVAGDAAEVESITRVQAQTCFCERFANGICDT